MNVWSVRPSTAAAAAAFSQVSLDSYTIYNTLMKAFYFVDCDLLEFD